MENQRVKWFGYFIHMDGEHNHLHVHTTQKHPEAIRREDDQRKSGQTGEGHTE